MTWSNRGWVITGSNFTDAPAGAPVNAPPVADPQSVSVLEDGYIAITLTATDPEGAPLTYAVLSGPSNGVLTGTAPNLIYTPTPNYFGSDSFTFQADDGTNLSNIATVSITVVNVNDAPTANPQSVVVVQDGYIAITLTGSDPEGNPLTYAVASGPSNGVLTGTAPNLTYTPTTSYVGPDSFTFTVNDGYVDSAPATVSIDVQVFIPAATLSADWIATSTIPSQLTFTRSGTATYIDSAGIIQTAASGVPRFNYDGYTLEREGLLIETQRTNNALNSGNLSSWTPVNLVGTANTTETTAPDGSNTATVYTETTATGQHRISTSASFASWSNGTTYSASIYAKARERNNIVIRAVGHTTDANRYISVQYNLTTGVATPYQGVIEAGQLLTYSMQGMPNGWWRCTVSWRAQSATGMDTSLDTFRICVSDGVATPTSFGVPEYTGDETKGIYLWGAQIEAGVKPTSYIPTTTAAVTRAVENLRVNSTTGWYNDPAWTVVHDTKRSIYSSNTPVDNWRHGPVDLEAQLTDLTYVRDIGQFFGLTGRSIDGGFWSFDGQAVVPSWNTPVMRDSQGAAVYSPDLNQFVMAHGTHSFGTVPARAYSTPGPDGGELAMTWTLQTIAAGVNGSSDMIWVPELSLYVSVVDNGTNRAMTSPDGYTWSASPISGSVAWRALTWAKELGLIVAVGGTGGIATSPDGSTWTNQTSPAGVWTSVTWAPELSLLVAVGTNAIATSSDGINWTSRTSPANQAWTCVAWSPELGYFAALSNNGTQRKMVSSDGINWSLRGGFSTPTGNTDSAYAWRKIVWSREFGSFVGIAFSTTNNLANLTWTPPTYTTRRFIRRRSARSTDKWVTGTNINGLLCSNLADITIANIKYYNVNFTQPQVNEILDQFYDP